MPTFRRAAFIITNIERMPRWGSPTRKPFAPSRLMTQVGEAWMPILWSVPPQNTGLRLPSARNFGTMNALMPLMPGGASGRRASTRCTMLSARSCSPNVIQTLVPVSR
jgi:hypothetical protein